MIDVYKCGTKIKLTNANVPGFITAICIRGKNITYEVSYFLNSVYCSNWFNSYEFELVEENESSDKIGFIK